MNIFTELKMCVLHMILLIFCFVLNVFKYICIFLYKLVFLYKFTAYTYIYIKCT